MGYFFLSRLINLIKPYKDLSNFQSILYDRRRMTKIHLLTSVVIACQQSFYIGELPRFNCLCLPIWIYSRENISRLSAVVRYEWV